MRGSPGNRQSGYALLLMLLALMGIGGAVMVGYTQGAKQQADHERYLHNQRVLREAKRALLQFAYNYPQFNDEGPGRLPCPDTDNDGNPGRAGSLTAPICGSVGRFPWNDPEMQFYDARDASNERLWYAVSNAFFNSGGGPTINSSATGTITIYDQTGARLYDGSSAGIAAVIIAPGPEIERNGVAQNRLADINDPIHYLDVFGALDNAAFTNSNAADGFVLGPIDDRLSGSIIVNDQMILVTAEEVIAVAEKAVLQAYRQAILDYSDRVEADIGAPPAPWTRYYPWLFNYAVNNVDTYPSDLVFATELATSLTNFGRVPSLYDEYFTETNSQLIESELEFDFSLTYPVTPIGVGFDQLTPAVASGNFEFSAAAQHRFSALSTFPQKIKFVDIDPNVTGDGRLSATAISSPPIRVELWFWDEAPLATGIWKLCSSPAGDVNDCNRDAAGNPTPGSPNLNTAEVLHVIATIDFSGTVNFDMDYATAPAVTVTSPADDVSHATIQAVFAGSDMLSIPVTLDYEIDRSYATSFIVGETGTLVLNDLTLGNVTLGLRYYPELPRWVNNNRWHDSVQMAYADSYRPDQIGVPADCTEGIDCVEFSGFTANPDNKKSLLVVAGEHDMLDGDAVPRPVIAPDLLFSNDLEDIFNPENSDLDRIFDGRTVEDPLALGDTELDKILVIEEL